MATAQKLLFATGDTVAQHTLWVTDGTTDGTYSLITSTSSSYADAEAGNFGGSPDFGILGNQVFFATSDTAHGEELWVTNGTTAGTSLLKDINPGTAGSAPNSFVAISSSELLFSADDGTDGAQLWITNGTTGGTSMLKDIYPGRNSYVDYFTPFRGGALFSADDGTHGGELWYTDGTTAGTSMLKDINPGAASSGFFSPSGPRYFLSLGSEAVFIANDGTHGLEPWVTDGTTAGTSLLKDINP
jgi:ELWxxDGT repeat protein